MSKLKNVRDDFPILAQKENGKPIVYLDNAATTHRPKQVVEAVENFINTSNGNPHRGSHIMSMRASAAMDKARENVRGFIGGKSLKEIIFTKNATEAMNLVAYSYGLNHIKKEDEIVISIAEHHANLVPWMEVAKKTGATLTYMYVDEEGRLPLSELDKITEKTKLVAVAHMSNVLGTIFPINEIIKKAHGVGAKVLVDGAQAVPHMEVNVEELNCDFYVFSGHKMYSLMGVGVLYGKEEILNTMEPFLYGGDMIEYVYEQEVSFNELPGKFEAGTPNLESIVSLDAAIDYMRSLGYDFIREKENELTSYALEKLKAIPYIKILGPTNMKDRGGVISFTVDEIHPHDVSMILDTYGIGVRAGHHCAQPLMRFLGVHSSSRVSFAFYNTKEEIDGFITHLEDVRRWMGFGSI